MNKQHIKIDCIINIDSVGIMGPKLKKDLNLVDSLYIIEHILLLNKEEIVNNYMKDWEKLQEGYRDEGLNSWSEVLIRDLKDLLEGTCEYGDYIMNTGVFYSEDMPSSIYIGVVLLNYLQSKNYI